MRERSVYLDVVRVVACAMVVAMHSPVAGGAADGNGVFLAALSYVTAPCVPLFFMVSGALLLPCGEDVSAGAFLRRRLGKVVWPTVAFSLFYIVLNADGGAVLVRSVASIPFSAQGHGVMWFMYTLAGLYLLVPVVSPWLRRAGRREVELYLLLWGATLMYPYVGLFLGVNSSATGVLYYFAGYAGYFLLGHYLHRYTVPARWIFLLAVAALPLPLADKLLGWGLDFYSAFWYLSAPVAVMAAAWFVGIRSLPLRHEMPAVTSVSRLSFGIYLVHIFVMRTVLWRTPLVAGIGNYLVQTLVVFALTFGISFAISWLVSKTPLSRWLIGV